LPAARNAAPRTDPAVSEQSMKQFRKGIRVLIAELGQATVNAALGDIPGEAWPSVLLH
jgi:hypothetical protein